MKEKNARIEKISFLCSELRMEKTSFFCNELLECQVCEEQCMDKVYIENCVLGDETQIREECQDILEYQVCEKKVENEA